MTTKREQIFEALFTLWGSVAGTTAERNRVVPERLDDGTAPLIVQQDGMEPPEPDIILSPIAYVYEETVELEVVAQGLAASLPATVDAILAAIGAQLAANRTLSGLADDVRVIRAPKIVDRAVSGAHQIRVATVPVMLQYTTSDPLA